MSTAPQLYESLLFFSLHIDVGAGIRALDALFLRMLSPSRNGTKMGLKQVIMEPMASVMYECH
jgi:hypothetical protein